MTDKARNKKIYKFAYSYLKQHLPEGISEAELKKYLSVDKKKIKGFLIVWKSMSTI